MWFISLKMAVSKETKLAEQQNAWFSIFRREKR